MIALHIYLRVTPGREADLERLYAATYVPVISVQHGFRSTTLLRTYDPYDPARYPHTTAGATRSISSSRAKRIAVPGAAGPEHVCGRATD